MIDVVYILGRGSRHQDLELYYSLLSVQKYLRNFRRIIVLGAPPQCSRVGLPKFTHVPADDPTFDKQKNARSKLLRAACSKSITEKFLLMNDDFFFLRETDAATIPYYRLGTLAAHIEWRSGRQSRYLESLRRTEQELIERRMPTLDFEVHAPIIYDRALLRQVLSTRFNWSRSPAPLARSLFANSLGVEGVLTTDFKIESPLPFAEIARRVASRPLLSLGDGALNTDMQVFLARQFAPEKVARVPELLGDESW